MPDLIEAAKVAGDWAVLLAGPAIVGYTVLYGLRSRWQASSVGRSVFWLAASLSLLVVLLFWAVLDRIWQWHHDDARTVFRFFAYGVTAVACWRLLIVLWKAQRDDRRRRAHQRGSTSGDRRTEP